MLDSRGFIHVPRPIRILALTLLGVVLVSALGMTAYYVQLDNPKDPKYADWILVGMSLIQMSLTGLALALLLFYTEREVSTSALKAKTDQFLDDLLPEALRFVSPSYAQRHEGCRVVKLGRSDIFGAAYELQSGELRLRVWIGLNVNRLIAIYWVAAPATGHSDAHIAELQAAFQYTFGGATKVGYSTSFEQAHDPAGRPIVSIWSDIKQPENLLLQPSERLFWMQDLAMMTESFWRTSLRKKIPLSDQEPSPL
jgi:hypothetical protein